MLIYRKIRELDIGPALDLLDRVEFINTGGTNGWLTDYMPFRPFVRGLGLPGIVTNINVRLLPALQGIPLHVDPKFKSEKVVERRFHIPLKTSPFVVMAWPANGVEVSLEAGWLYEVNHHLPHEVIHRAAIDRIHIAVDTAEAA